MAVHMHNELKRGKNFDEKMHRIKSNQRLVIFFSKGPTKKVDQFGNRKQTFEITLFFHFKFIVHALISYALKIVS